MIQSIRPATGTIQVTAIKAKIIRSETMIESECFLNKLNIVIPVRAYLKIVCHPRKEKYRGDVNEHSLRPIPRSVLGRVSISPSEILTCTCVRCTPHEAVSLWEDDIFCSFGEFLFQ